MTTDDVALLRKLHAAGRLVEIRANCHHLLPPHDLYIVRRERDGGGFNTTWYIGKPDEAKWVAQGFTLADVLTKMGIETD